MTFETVIERFGARRNGSGWMARCPAHEDAKASLSINRGDNVETVVRCQAGCATDVVLAAKGLTMADLQFERTDHCKPQIVATYDYTDEHGALLYQAVRFSPKDFRQRRPDGAGGWIWKLDDVRRVLFGLPELRDQKVTFITEGEKDVLALRAIGLVATTNAGGASKNPDKPKWRSEYAEQLKAAGVESVVVLPDNDDPGRAHAEAVARSCHAAELKTKIVALPDLPAKGDVSEWLAAAHTKAELVALVKATALYTPTPAPEGEPLPWARSLPDLIADVAAAPDVLPLISGFVLSDLITLLHGQPRDWKTIVALHVALAVATGRALFGLARLSVPVARNVLYLTEEDGARRVTERLRMICAGLGCEPPVNLFVAAGTGFSLDDLDSQARLIAFVREHNIALVMPDPLRSLSGCVDQGPRELRPLVLTLRGLMRETGCTIFAVHHDSKPLAIGVDARRRPQRASGGAVFSIADSPIGIDALPDGRRLLTPTAWKFSEDPPSIALAIETGDGWLRLVGADADGATSPADADLSGRILAFLAANPRTSGAAIQRGVKARKADVFATLERLAGIGKIDSAKVGRLVLWFATYENGREPLGNRSNEPDPTVPDVGTISQERSIPERSMVPDNGNRSEPLEKTVQVPASGSRSYIGTARGNRSIPDQEHVADGGADGYGV